MSYNIFSLAVCLIILSVSNTFFAQDRLSSNTIISKIHLINQNSELQISTEPAISGSRSIQINQTNYELIFVNGRASISLDLSTRGGLYFFRTEKEKQLYHLSLDTDQQIRIQHIPLWLSVLPPLVAILLALLLKEVIVSLFIGIWMGAFIAHGMRIDSFFYYFESLFHTVDRYIIQSLADTGHLSVIVFSLFIGGMVAIISKNGGMLGIVKQLSRYATTARSTQFVTWLLGVAIFFDDYANTLIVGNTMRSVTDRFRISREKLAYIVDSTAAPVAAVAFITTWIGAELGYIDSGLSQITNWDISQTPYSIFLQSLKYSFYPILTLSFILLLIFLGRDYGPMYKAEYRARKTGQVSSAANPKEDEPNMEDLSPLPNSPANFWDALLPILTVISITIVGLLVTGMQNTYSEILPLQPNLPNTWSSIWHGMDQLWSSPPSFIMKLSKIIGNADSYVALLWASLSGVILAILMSIYRRTMNLFHSLHWMTTGFKTMMPAVIILSLAWALALTTKELHTASFIAGLLQGAIAPVWIPAIIFLLSAAIAFSTGSSWSTMAILYPIAIPTTYVVCEAVGLPQEQGFEILLNVIANVLAASVLGDHCSPISDTTILSSLASDCNHIDHVRTQLPYALTVGSMAFLCVVLSTFMSGSAWVSVLLLLCSLLIFWVIIRYMGKPTTEQ